MPEKRREMGGGRDFAKEIADQEAQLTSLKVEMDALVDQFVEAAGRFLASWYQVQAKREIENNADVTLNLPREDLAALKRDVEVLSKKALEIAKKELSSPKVWWHRADTVSRRTSTGSDSPYWKSEKRLPGLVEHPMRYAMGHLAPLLEAKGYLKDRSKASVAAWRHRDERSLETRQSGYFSEYHFRWPDDLCGIVTKYAALYGKAVTVVEIIDRVKREKKESEAKGLWETL